MKSLKEQIKGGIFGVAVGDALGVPVEFKTRTFLQEHPVKDFLGYLCWNQPPGTWSDDSSLTFCLIDSLLRGYDIEDIGQTFVKWYKEGFWGAHYEVFDVGGTTSHSLDRILKGESAKYSGNLFVEDNGNGSLMRTLPMVYILKEEGSITERYKKIKEVSSITHAHFRSVFACFIYVEYGLLLLKGQDKFEAYENCKQPILDFAHEMDFNPTEISLFNRVLRSDIREFEEKEVESSGYVLHSLEAALWCFLKLDSYEEAVLKAVNLGGDTDTTAAITGGLAGLYYGYNAIPTKWKTRLARFEDIENLTGQFNENLV